MTSILKAGVAVMTLMTIQGCSTLGHDSEGGLRVIEVVGPDFAMATLGHSSDVVEIQEHDEHVVCFDNCPDGRKGLRGEVIWIYFADEEVIDLSPVEVEEQWGEGSKTTVFSKNFSFDSSKLVGKLDGLEKVAKAALDDPELRIRIEGHTDSVGRKVYNKRLSLQRALAVSSWLERRGVTRDRLDISGFGEARPIATNKTAVGREKNRRAEVVLMLSTVEQSNSEEMEDAGR